MFDELNLSEAAAHTHLCGAVKVGALSSQSASASVGLGEGSGGGGAGSVPSISSRISPEFCCHIFASGNNENVAIRSVASLTSRGRSAAEIKGIKRNQIKIP